MSRSIGGTVWRDRGFRGYDTVYLLAPLREDVLRALPAAAAATARSEGLRPLPDAAPARLDAGVSDLALIAAARAAGRPLSVVVAGDRVAVHLPHELADGVEGTRIVASLLELAAGGRPQQPARSARYPLLMALRSGGRPALLRYLAGRRERRELPHPGEPRDRTDGRFARITLDAADVAALRRTASPGGRATPMSRVASVALAALADIAPRTADARVVLPVDLRPLLDGRRVAGNFVSAEAYGTLRTTDWTPANVNRLLAARRGTGAVALAAGSARSLLRRSGGGPVPSVSVSLMGPIELPDVWAGGPASLGCATVGQASGVFVFVAQVRDGITVSVWDDTGIFDVEAFGTAFRDEIVRRTPA